MMFSVELMIAIPTLRWNIIYMSLNKIQTMTVVSALQRAVFLLTKKKRFRNDWKSIRAVAQALGLACTTTPNVRKKYETAGLQSNRHRTG